MGEGGGLQNQGTAAAPQLMHHFLQRSLSRAATELKGGME
jgi:hypothetical protein